VNNTHIISFSFTKNKRRLNYSVRAENANLTFEIIISK